MGRNRMATFLDQVRVSLMTRVWLLGVLAVAGTAFAQSEPDRAHTSPEQPVEGPRAEVERGQQEPAPAPA